MDERTGSLVDGKMGREGDFSLKIWIRGDLIICDAY